MRKPHLKYQPNQEEIVMRSQYAALGVASGRNSSEGFISQDLRFNLKLVITIAFFAVVFGMLLPKNLYQIQVSAQTETVQATVQGFPYSTPITINSTGTELWVTNPDPDNNSVTVVDVTGDTGTVLDEIPVGKEPSSIALTADSPRPSVANPADGTVPVINTKRAK